MNPRVLPKRVQSILVVLLGFLLAMLVKWTGISVPDIPAVNLGVFEVPALPVPQWLMVAGVGYLMIAWADQGRKAFTGRNAPAESLEDDE